MQCKSLRIKAPAKWMNVNASVYVEMMMLKPPASK